MKIFRKYISYIIIILVGFIDIIYGSCVWYQKELFINQAKITKGDIYSISNNKKSRLLYVNYYVNGQRYDGVIVTTNKDISISDSINIYYNKDNPNKISNGEIKHLEYIVICLGVLFVFLGFLLAVMNYKKEIEKRKQL